MAEKNSPPRCLSCGAVIALDEIEVTGREWVKRQSFDDFFCIPDELEHLRDATFVATHPFFAVGCLCPSCRYPFSVGDFSDAHDPDFDVDDQDSIGEVPF
jgi:hypothetical protein